MEEERSGNKLVRILKMVPSWVHVAIGVGGLVFTAGTAYSEIKSNTIRLSKVEEAQQQQSLMASEVSNLHIQIENQNKTQETTNQALIKLTDSVNDLSVSVGRLEGRLGEESNKKKR